MTDSLFRPPRCGITPASSNKKSGMDSDRLLVLVLAVILLQNGAPFELILALLYVAM